MSFVVMVAAQIDQPQGCRDYALSELVEMTTWMRFEAILCLLTNIAVFTDGGQTIR
jgi:hypothetical protein